MSLLKRLFALLLGVTLLLGTAESSFARVRRHKRSKAAKWGVKKVKPQKHKVRHKKAIPQ